jgi:hypothetical protein
MTWWRSFIAERRGALNLSERAAEFSVSAVAMAMEAIISGSRQWLLCGFGHGRPPLTRALCAFNVETP